jgi:hypothetical protein
MSVRIHVVLDKEEKAALERAARRAGVTLSAWLRDAAREKLSSTGPPALATADELRDFFQTCDAREVGVEPDWETHRRVIDGSRTEGAPDL